MKTAYTPTAGSTADRIIKHLQTQPAGTELTSAELVERVGLDSTDIVPFMQGAIRFGVIRRGLKAGTRLITWSLITWSLGDGKPLEPPKDDAEDEPTPRKRTAAPAADKLATGAMLGWKAAAPKAEETTEREAVAAAITTIAATTAAVDAWVPEPTPVPPAQAPFACALWSDGRLQLVIEGRPVTLAAADTKALVHYLDRMAIEA